MCDIGEFVNDVAEILDESAARTIPDISAGLPDIIASLGSVLLMVNVAKEIYTEKKFSWGRHATFILVVTLSMLFVTNNDFYKNEIHDPLVGYIFFISEEAIGEDGELDGPGGLICVGAEGGTRMMNLAFAYVGDTSWMDFSIVDLVFALIMWCEWLVVIVLFSLNVLLAYVLLFVPLVLSPLLITAGAFEQTRGFAKSVMVMYMSATGYVLIPGFIFGACLEAVDTYAEKIGLTNTHIDPEFVEDMSKSEAGLGMILIPLLIIFIIASSGTFVSYMTNRVERGVSLDISGSASSAVNMIRSK